MKSLRDALTIAGRELRALFHEPIAWVVLVLFLVVQGASFYAVLKVLANPWQPGPYGAVLRTHFGGTFLHWAFLFFACATLTMRLVAEERRAGTWETLRTVPVSEGAIALGKWLGALGFYAFLWLPTLVYPLILRAFAPPGATLDWGPIGTAYLGILLMGAAFLAVGLAASALTSSQLVASAVTFVTLLLLFLIGLSPEIAPATFEDSPRLASLVRAVDVRGQMDDFARGVVDSRHVAVLVGIAVVALVGAAMACGAGRWRRDVARRGAMGVALIAAAVVLANVLAARHPVRSDATAAGVTSIDGRTRAILRDLHAPVRILILRGGVQEFAPIWEDVRELARQMAARQPLVSVEEIDLALAPGRAEELAREHALAVEEVAGGGAVVVSSDERTRAIGLLDLAAFGRDAATGAGKVTSFHAEAELVAAILEVSADERPEVCFTSGHGELPLEERPDGRDLSALVTTLRRDALRTSVLPGLATGVPARCAAVAIVGATRAFAPDEARVLVDWLDGGGRLFVALDAGLAPTGLELVLDRVGLAVTADVASDPELAPAEMRRAILVRATYGDHPVVRPFQGRRDTLWHEPRIVTGGVPLVMTTTRVAVAAAAEQGGARVIAVGSARAFRTDVVELGGQANDAFAAAALSWITGRARLVEIPPRTPEQLRVLMTPAQLDRMFWLCLAGLPGLAAGLGLFLAWRRRRAG